MYTQSIQEGPSDALLTGTQVDHVKRYHNTVGTNLGICGSNGSSDTISDTLTQTHAVKDASISHVYTLV